MSQEQVKTPYDAEIARLMTQVTTRGQILPAGMLEVLSARREGYRAGYEAGVEAVKTDPELYGLQAPTKGDR